MLFLGNITNGISYIENRIHLLGVNSDINLKKIKIIEIFLKIISLYSIGGVYVF